MTLSKLDSDLGICKVERDLLGVMQICDSIEVYCIVKAPSSPCS